MMIKIHLNLGCSLQINIGVDASDSVTWETFLFDLVNISRDIGTLDLIYFKLVECNNTLI